MEREKEYNLRNKNGKNKSNKNKENNRNTLLQKKTKRDLPKKKPEKIKSNKNNKQTIKRKYSFSNNNLNIINLRSRDKANDSKEKRILTRRKGSIDSVDMISSKKKKK